MMRTTVWTRLRSRMQITLATTMALSYTDEDAFEVEGGDEDDDVVFGGGGVEAENCWGVVYDDALIAR